jgi:UDP-3-O-[3-hydroxymyristoyl] glucosamine N-acyltransferase
MAGQVGVRDHVHVGDRAVLCAQAGIMNEVPVGAVFLGSPAMAERDQMHVWALERKLPEMRKALKALTRQVEELTRISKPAARAEAA